MPTPGTNSYLSELTNDIKGVGTLATGAMGTLAGLEQGGARGDTQAALSAAKTGASFGAFGQYSQAVGNYLGDVANLGGIYQGIQQGGPLGYTGAGINAATLAARIGTQGLPGLVSASEIPAGVSSAAGEALQVLGPLAAAYNVYGAVKGWQSGQTGMDILRGAEAGASVGSVIPGVGTLIGAGVGAAVGGISSLFGPGRQDPENTSWDQYAAAYQHGGAQGVSGASASTNFQMLSGIFDARGSNIPFFQQYGRMGENRFTSDMFKQVDAAIKSGKLTPNATPQQMYSQVVQPWISKMSPNGWRDTATIQGAPEKAAVGNLLTSMLGQWQQGQITSSTKLGIGGQTLQGGVPAFAGSQASAPPQAQQNAATGQSLAQQMVQQYQQLTQIFEPPAWMGELQLTV